MDVAPNAYAYMFESTPVALCATDGEGRILVINPAVERLLGWTMSEHTGRLLADRLRQAIVDPAQALCWTVALGEALAQGKTTYLDLPAGFRTGFPDGHLESVSGVVVACQHSADQRGLLVVFHNGSLMDSMSAARTRFFSAISHEFGTPLSNIASAIDLLAGHLDPAQLAAAEADPDSPGRASPPAAHDRAVPAGLACAQAHISAQSPGHAAAYHPAGGSDLCHPGRLVTRS